MLQWPTIEICCTPARQILHQKLCKCGQISNICKERPICEQHSTNTRHISSVCEESNIPSWALLEPANRTTNDNSNDLHLHRFLDSHCQIDSSQCLTQLTPARVGTARSVRTRAIGGITPCHKMRHNLSLPTVTYARVYGRAPHFHHDPTTSFLHSHPIQTPPSGPGLICAADQMFIWDDPSVTPLS